MANITYEVTKYHIRYHGTSAHAKNTDIRARVMLTGATPGKILAYLDFYPSDVVGSKQDRLQNASSATPTMQAYLSIDEIGPVLDMLRNEEPIYITWIDHYQQVWLDTAAEPVGEEES